MERLTQFCAEHNIVMEYELTLRNPWEGSYHFHFQRGDLVRTCQVNYAEIANTFVEFELRMIEDLKRDFHLEETEWAKEALNNIYGMKKEKERMDCDYSRGMRSMFAYVDEDVKAAMTMYNQMYQKKTPKQKALAKIQNVIFNDPATIVFWSDGTKTVVKAENEPYDPEKGLAMAIAKKFFDNKSYYFDVFKKWLPAEEKEEEIVDLKTGLTEEDKKMIVELVRKDKETAIPLREYCAQENITKNKAMGQIRRGEIIAFKNEKGLWMVVRD